MIKPAISLFLICVLTSLSAESAFAQKYITAGGVRFEKDRLGFTVQQRIFKKTTLELIGMGKKDEVSAHLLAQQHFPLLGRRLNLYFGAGAHAGSHKALGSYTGADLITGIEYKVNGLPFLLSFDFKPAIHINHEDWLTPSTAFSLRYVFVKEKKPVLGFFKGMFKRDKEEDD